MSQAARRPPWLERARTDRVERRWLIAFVVMVAVSLVVALGAGYWEWRKLAPRAVGHAKIGEWFTVGSMRFRVDGIDHATSYPSSYGSDPEVAPAGSQIVRVRITTEALDNLDPYDYYCRYTLRGPDGIELDRYGPDVAGPTGKSCVATVSRPIMKGEKTELQSTYLVPERYVDDLSLELVPSGFGRPYWLVG